MEVARDFYRATWGRVFAAAYDRGLAATEEAGLREQRRALLAGVSGDVCEIGAGTGLNLELYPAAGLARLALCEPSPHMASRLRTRAAEAGQAAEVVEAPAEDLPFASGSFDWVVSTLVLCTVGSQERALAEVARVLRPGGRLAFIEHVRAPDDPGRAKWQDRLERPWRFWADGCRPNRDTVAAIEASALSLEELERGKLRKAPPIVRPLVTGRAVRAAYA